MLVSGSQLLYGLYIGKKPEAVRSVFSVDLILSAAAAAITSAVMLIFVFTGVTSVFASGNIQTYFNRYLIGQAVGIPALVLGQQLFGFLSLENQSRLTMTASIVCFVSNALLDYILIAVIPLGILGLGLASAISNWIFFGVQALYYLRGKSQMKFSLKACVWHDAPDIIRRGYSGALSRFVEMFRCIVVNALIVKCVGDVGLSSFAASNAFLGIIWALPFGEIAVARMLFSISMGEEDRQSVTDIMRVIIRKAVPLMCVVAAALTLLAHPITRLYYRDASAPVYSMTVMAFRMLPLCMPLAVISLSFATYAQAAQKKLLSVVLPVVDGFVSVSVFSLFLIPLMKMNGLYLANILNGVVCLLLVIAFARKGLGRFPGTVEELLDMPDDFGTMPEERMDITVRSMDEVVTVSEKIIAFCEKRGIDQLRSFYSGLAMEEMAGNVVLHGFTKGRKKPHSIDIRVVHRDEEILLRIRDDCVPFDPSYRAQLLSDEDKIKNGGIRLVFETAKEVRYQNLLGLNVLTILI